jgi:hypothetical protein
MSAAIEIINCEQGTDAWLDARLGIPTASMFATVMASGRGGGESKTRDEYMRKLIGERITGKPMYHYTNAHMERGHIQEDEARELYAMLADVEPERVGFVRFTDRTAGASPDSLIGSDGLLEIKTKLAHLQIHVLESDAVPAEHLPQIQGQLWVTGRAWCDFVSYCPRLPPFVRRVERDETMIARIADAVGKFNIDMGRRAAAINARYIQEAA